MIATSSNACATTCTRSRPVAASGTCRAASSSTSRSAARRSAGGGSDLASPGAGGRASTGAVDGDAPSGGGAAPTYEELRQARKDVQRIERQLAKLDVRVTELHGQMAAAATDHERLRALDAERAALEAEREQAEADWLEASSIVEA